MKKLTFLLFFTSIISFSQERTVFFGKIVDDLGELENAHIINVNTNQATNSNPQGEFKIFAKVKDSLKITSIGYKTKTLILKNLDFGITEKQIHLKKEIVELDEVNINRNNLLGQLSSDVKNIKTKEEINAKTLGLPNAEKRKLTIAERRLYTAMGGRTNTMQLGFVGLGTAISVDRIINSLSGRLKKLKKHKVIEDNEKQITYLKNTFKNYIIQDLKIDSTNVSRFIYYCQEDENYTTIKQQGNFALIEHLNTKAIQFKKLNK